jgi:class 3 adenylate cyclase/ligand-binding sensor domain-containing protein
LFKHTAFIRTHQIVVRLQSLLLLNFICLASILLSCEKGDEAESRDGDYPKLKFSRITYRGGIWKDSLIGPVILNKLPFQKLGLVKNLLSEAGKSQLNWLFQIKPAILKNRFKEGPGIEVVLRKQKFGGGKAEKVPQLPVNRSSYPGLMHLKNKQGIPGTSVQAICEDFSGRLWIGTDNGLAVYDGNSIHSFSMEDGLPNQYITSLVAYENGQIAIGTKSGLVLTDGLHFEHISHKEGLLSNWITRLHVSGRKLFIGTEAGLQVLENGSLLTPELPEKKVSSISGWQKNRLCIGYSSGEAIQLNLLSGQMESIRPFPDNGITGISHFQDGEILLNIDRHGLFRWKNDSLFAGYSPAVNFTLMELHSFYPAKDKIWFCGFNSGMYGLDIGGNLEILKPEDGLISDQLSSLLRLKDGSFLLGSWGGLNILKDLESRQYFSHPNLNGKIPFGAAFSPDSSMWISTMDGGVNRWKNGNGYSYSEQSGLRTGTVFNFAFGNKGLTYMATSGDGLKIIDGNKTYTLEKAQGLASLNVNTVLMSSDTTVYIGTNESGLYKWKNENLYHLQTRKEIPGQSVYSLFETPSGEIIVGTNGDGIFSLQNGNFRKLIPAKGQEIPAIYPITWWNNQLCFGTFGGGMFLLKGDSLARIGEKEGLANQTVLSMAAISPHELICGTGKGISILRQKNNGLLIRNLNAADAFQYEDFNPYSAAFDGKNLWMGAGDSFLKLSADGIRKIPAPIPLITGIDFGDKEFLRLSTSGKLLFIGDSAENMDIPFSQNSSRIRIGHSGMAFPQDKIEYNWQLFPLEKNWKKTGEITTAEYPRLDAGRYTFRFRVREAGMEWSRVHEINFTILPPWWQTWWFYLLEGVFGLLMIWGFVQFRTRNLRKQKEKLEETVKVRTAEVVKQKEMVELERHKSEELLLNILPENVAEELKNTGRYEARHFEEVTIMFTDFKDFTKISETMSPTELVEEIDEYFRAFDAIVQKHGVEKIKTIGDSYMAAGGIPVSDPDHAVKMVAAALEIRDQVDKIRKDRESAGRPGFQARIGIHTGPVVAGIVGSRKFAYDIWGDSVNLASRLESSGEAGKINISIATYQKIKDSFICVPRGKISTKSKGDVEMYFVEKKTN